MSDVDTKRKKSVKRPKVEVIDVRELREDASERRLSVKAGFKLKVRDEEAEDVDFIPAKAEVIPTKLKTPDSKAFVDRTLELLQRLDEERANSPVNRDSDIMYEFYKATLADTLELVPIAKRTYVRFQNQSNAYAYNGLVTKCQELLADLQALNTKGDLLERIIDTSINPSFMAIVSNLSNTFVDSQELVKKMDLSTAQRDQVLDILKNLVRSTGNHLQEVQRGLQADLLGRMGDGN